MAPWYVSRLASIDYPRECRLYFQNPNLGWSPDWFENTHISSPGYLEEKEPPPPDRKKSYQGTAWTWRIAVLRTTYVKHNFYQFKQCPPRLVPDTPDCFGEKIIIKWRSHQEIQGPWRDEGVWKRRWGLSIQDQELITVFPPPSQLVLIFRFWTMMLDSVLRTKDGMTFYRFMGFQQASRNARAQRKKICHHELCRPSQVSIPNLPYTKINIGRGKKKLRTPHPFTHQNTCLYNQLEIFFFLFFLFCSTTLILTHTHTHKSEERSRKINNNKRPKDSRNCTVVSPWKNASNEVSRKISI